MKEHEGRQTENRVYTFEERLQGYLGDVQKALTNIQEEQRGIWVQYTQDAFRIQTLPGGKDRGDQLEALRNNRASIRTSILQNGTLEDMVMLSRFRDIEQTWFDPHSL